MGRPLRNHVVVPDSEVPGGRRSISRYLYDEGSVVLRATVERRRETVSRFEGTERRIRCGHDDDAKT